MDEDIDYIDDAMDAEFFSNSARRSYQRFDPFQFYDDREFLQRFRFSKDEMRRLDALIRDKFDMSDRGHNVTPLQQLLVTMRFLATGCFQRVCADFMGVSTSSANRIIHRVCNMIAAMHKDFINFPQTDEEIRETKVGFYNYCRFPGVVGAIDCTHIPIQNPGGETAEIYRNRKGYHSLNVQVMSQKYIIYMYIALYEKPSLMTKKSL